MGKGIILLRKAFIEMESETPNLNRVFEWLQKSAEQNNPEALYAVGTWYLHGKFVKKDSSLAVDFFLKAIKGYNKDAYYDLALCYESGEGIKKNYKKAFECYLNAAILGDKQSLYEVGRCYYHGIGIPKNETIGLIWLEHAKLNGIEG